MAPIAPPLDTPLSYMVVVLLLPDRGCARTEKERNFSLGDQCVAAGDRPPPTAAALPKR
jgi:hypothetical protein